jgi:RNA polymerase sigma-70 factor (ECF subfamily)
VRAWLYRIATNACLDALERRPRKPSADGEIAWLQPYPDELLEGIPAEADEPDAEIVARETIELAFMVAIQHLAPRPRAALILRDILGWRAKETASLLGTSEAAVNSALQRARAGMKEHLLQQRLEWTAEGSAEERALVARYIETTESADVNDLAALIHEDAAFWMPPEPGLYVGRDTMISAWREGGLGDTEKLGHFRLLETRANNQPALANYLKAPGESVYKALLLDVLRVEGGMITEIIAFPGRLFPAFGLPTEL